MKKPKVCIIIPTLFEAHSIGQVLEEIPRQALAEQGYEVEVLVIDGGSTDGTVEIAREKGATAVIEKRRGKGRAMRTALELTQADFIFMMDGDYTYPASHIPEMLARLKEGYSVVIGSRLRGKIEEGGMSRLNLVGNHLLSLMARILYRTGISDLCTGFWGLRGEVIPNLTLSADGFDFEAELFVQLAKKRFLIAEVPIYYRRRQTPPKLRSLSDGFKIGRALLRWRLQRLRRHSG